MPRLHGYVVYRFVKPFVGADGRDQWRHPDGWKFTIVEGALAIDAYAERAERWVVRTRDQVKFCAERGHESEGGCGPAFTSGPHAGRHPCAVWLEEAPQYTRSAERTMLVRIEVPA